MKRYLMLSVPLLFVFCACPKKDAPTTVPKAATSAAATAAKDEAPAEPSAPAETPDSEAAAAPAAAPPAAKAPVGVHLDTTKGKITLELYPDKAPKTVENFLAYVRAGHYDGTIFHRVISNFMIQGGGFTADLVQKPTRSPVVNEADNGLRNDRGTIAMARTSDPHSGTTQFFINVQDNAALNHSSKTPSGWGYAVFGKVVEGMDVVDAIKDVKTGGRGMFPRDVPLENVVITTAKIVD